MNGQLRWQLQQAGRNGREANIVSAILLLPGKTKRTREIGKVCVFYVYFTEFIASSGTCGMRQMNSRLYLPLY